MIGKIKKGSGFKGCVNYVLGKEQAALLHAEGVLAESNRDIIRSFILQAGMNPDLKKPVGHIALSYSPVDAPKLTDGKMVQLAQEYMREMKITDTQYIIVRHQDREHPHVHIAFNRIDNNGNTISDRNDRLRSTRICKELTQKYGLHMANGKDNVKRERLKESDRTKYELYDILKKEVGRCGNWNVLVANLKRQGVEVSFKHKRQTNEVQGVVFTKNGYRFNGSKVDRCFSYTKIDAVLQRNRYNERMGMTAKVHDVATPNAPSGSARNELFNGSLGLLNGNGSSYNAADAEANQEMAEMLRRKKKRKRGMRL